jgi:enterochelin esterase-like enzyme
MNASLTTSPVLAAFGLAALACVVASFVFQGRKRRGLRRAMTAVAVLLTMATAADGVNAYFDYIPTVGSLLGRRAADQATAVQVQARLASVPRPLLHGLVEKVAIPGPVSGFHARQAQVYLPPAFFLHPQPALPVVELLHGTPGTPEDWTRAGAADQTTDAFAATHNGMAPIVLMVDENGGFTNDTECAGDAERYLTVDVPNWAMAKLGVRTDRMGWVVAGSSEGGYCALDLALRHRDRFGSFVDLSGLDRPTHHGGTGTLFHSHSSLLAHTPRWLLRTHLPPGPALAGWFEVGGADNGTTRSELAAARLATAAGIQTRLLVVPNAHHTWRVWHHAYADALPWITWRTGLSTTPPPVSARTRSRAARARSRRARSGAPTRLHLRRKRSRGV